MEEQQLKINKIYHMDCLEGIKRMRIPDLIIADPPYEFEAMSGGIHQVGRGVVKYQNIIDAGTNHFNFEKFIPPILDLQKDRVNAYFFCNKVLVPKYLSEAIKRGLKFDILALRKLNPIPAKASSFLPELEYVIFLRSPGVYFDGTLHAKNYKKIYDKFIGGDENIHPNIKPQGMIRRYIKISSKEGDLVLDPFTGSGTTLIVAKQLNRNFIGFETNPKYVQMIKERLTQQTLGFLK